MARRTRPTMSEMEALTLANQRYRDGVREVLALLQAFEGQWDPVGDYLGAHPETMSVRCHLVAIAKSWFRDHSTSSMDRVSRGARALLLAAGEEAWLSEAKMGEPAPVASPVKVGKTDGAGSISSG